MQNVSLGTTELTHWGLVMPYDDIDQGLYSLSDKTSHRKILQNLEAARLDVIMLISLYNLTGT